MLKGKMKRADGHGFTIVELMIATAVFAVVLMVAQTSFMHIGHLFYKGVSITQTQDVMDHIFQDINGNFQAAASVSGSQDSGVGGYDYYCVGGTRYTYRIDHEVDSSAAADHSATGNFGILKDKLPGSTACATPCPDTGSVTCASGTVKFNNPIEMLSNKMRVEQFNLAQSTTTSNLYNVALVLAYGDDNTLTYNTPADKSTVACQGDTQNNFCAVSRLNTTVYRGWHQ